MVMHVVVVGAGYAGVMAANRVASAGVEGTVVTVINPRAEFVERVRLHQYAAGSGSATVPLSDLLRRDVRLRVATVDRIDDRSVHLADGQVVDFDYLVYAVGSAEPGPECGVDDIYSVNGLEAAERLRARLQELTGGARAVVVGGGLTGIETSAEVAEQFPEFKVHLVTRSVAASMSEKGRAEVKRALTELGVTIHAGQTVTAVRAGVVELADGGRLEAECVIWAGAFTVPDLAERSGLPVDENGRLRTDESLVCIGNPRIVAVGDAAAPPRTVGGHIRMSCQASIPMGSYGADTVVALLKGQQTPPLVVGFVGQSVSLGRRRALIQVTGLDDVPRSWSIRGRPAAVIKEAVCRASVQMIRRAPRIYRWLPGPRRVATEAGLVNEC